MNNIIDKVIEAKEYICGPDFDLNKNYKIKIIKIDNCDYINELNKNGSKLIGVVGEVIKGGDDVKVGEVGYWMYDMDKNKLVSY